MVCGIQFGRQRHQFSCIFSEERQCQTSGVSGRHHRLLTEDRRRFTASGPAVGGRCPRAEPDGDAGGCTARTHAGPFSQQRGVSLCRLLSTALPSLDSSDPLLPVNRAAPQRRHRRRKPKCSTLPSLPAQRRWTPQLIFMVTLARSLRRPLLRLPCQSSSSSPTDILPRRTAPWSALMADPCDVPVPAQPRGRQRLSPDQTAFRLCQRGHDGRDHMADRC